MPVELSSFNGDETLMIQGNKSDGYASIVSREQRAELFDRIGTLERDNMRLRGRNRLPSMELPKNNSVEFISTFGVTNLKKCLSDETQVILLDEIQIDDTLHFIEETVEITDREVKRLKQSCIPIVKVR
ncbi:hypothetical protein Tco_0809811 [Tanacetum coccineum]